MLLRIYLIDLLVKDSDADPLMDESFWKDLCLVTHSDREMSCIGVIDRYIVD